MQVKTGWIVGGIAALAIGGALLLGVSTSNTEIAQRAQFEAQQRDLKQVHATVWNILKEQAGVTEEYRDSFDKVYSDLMAGRYQGNGRGGALMSWVHEANPNFDASLYRTLMDSIEIQRTKFSRAQTAILDLDREHNKLLRSFPSSVFVGGRPPFDVKIVTSSRTEQAFDSGQENDIGLFEKKQPPAKPPGAGQRIPPGQRTPLRPRPVPSASTTNLPRAVPLPVPAQP